MKKNRVIQALVFLAVTFFIGEVTFGNPDFPLTLWTFQKISAITWNLTVHLFGSLLLLAVNKIFIKKHISIPILLSTLYFLGGEIVNWHFLQYFRYEDYPFGAVGSFWIIIGMFIGICTISSIILRKE